MIVHYHVQPLVYAVTFVVCFPLESNFPSSTEVLLPMISKFILGWIVSLGFVFLANHGHRILTTAFRAKEFPTGEMHTLFQMLEMSVETKHVF